MDYFKWLIVYNLIEFEIMNSINVSTLSGSSRKFFIFIHRAINIDKQPHSMIYIFCSHNFVDFLIKEF